MLFLICFVYVFHKNLCLYLCAGLYVYACIHICLMQRVKIELWLLFFCEFLSLSCSLYMDNLVDGEGISHLPSQQ